MKETILTISETSFDSNNSLYNNTDGYIITTSSQEIRVGIYNQQDCCEDWGYFISEDDLNRFIGSQLLEIKITDELLKQGHFDVNSIYEGGVMFVDFITSKGVFQFVAYNSHNGYYGHRAGIVSKQLNYNEVL